MVSLLPAKYNTIQCNANQPLCNCIILLLVFMDSTHWAERYKIHCWIGMLDQYARLEYHVILVIVK